MAGSVGSTAANFHDAARSEYLAQYVFSCFGTSVPIPRQEDTGLDLFCTLTERIGQRIWPMHYFSVQVKSTMDPWKFESEGSIRWLIEHPLPIFLAVVHKSEARVCVYQTSPRFYVWSLPPLPPRLILQPSELRDGRCTEWAEGEKFGLSAPILDFTVQDILNDEFRDNAKEVLKRWLEIDNANLLRIRNRLRQFTVPYDYLSNTVPSSSLATQGINFAAVEDVNDAVLGAKAPLLWLSNQLFKNGDLRGALRAALLCRHLYANDSAESMGQFLVEINKTVGNSSYRFAGLDYLSKRLDELYPSNADKTF